MRTIILLLATCYSFILTAQTSYVNAEASGENNGSSWVNAYTEVRTALENVSSGDIWVAEGTYYPTAGTDRTSSFRLAPNVNIYGGFPDKGNPVWEDRDWVQFHTVLSGDLGAEIDTSENSYKIMTLNASPDSHNEIDGFTFTGGNSDYDGSCIDMSGSISGSSEAIVRNCTFTDNFADYSGAGLSCSQFNLLTVDNCFFTDNYSGYEGACIDASRSNLTILRSYFSDNYADYEGAAISFFAGHDADNDFTLRCDQSIFQDNYADYEGGVIDAWGRVILTNCLFTDNAARREGGVVSLSRYGTLNAYNCTFSNNEAGLRGSILEIGSIVLVTPLTANFTNCIFAENTGSPLISTNSNVGSVDIEYSFLDNCPPGTICEEGNIFGSEPDFVSADDYRLAAGSICINAGTDDGTFGVEALDLAGENRIFGPAIDMGAYEFTETSNALEAFAQTFELYPNPVTDVVNLRGMLGEYQVTLIDARGRKISHWELSGSDNSTLYLGNFDIGFYTLLIQRNELTISRKVIISR